MSEPRLDWNTAEVDDSKLKVSIDGEPPRGWSDTFERTARLLAGGDWGEVKLKKGSVQVTGVTPGNEDKLRHYLESVVHEANATHASDEDDGDSESERSEAEASRDSDDESPPSPDAEMTERFRSFAQAPRST